MENKRRRVHLNKIDASPTIHCAILVALSQGYRSLATNSEETEQQQKKMFEMSLILMQIALSDNNNKQILFGNFEIDVSHFKWNILFDQKKRRLCDLSRDGSA